MATGLTMEFEFGTNRAFYSSFVGDIFGAPLAIEGLMAFFMESIFIGLMAFGCAMHATRHAPEEARKNSQSSPRSPVSPQGC